MLQLIILVLGWGHLKHIELLAIVRRLEKR